MITRTELLYDADHGTDNEGWYVRLHHDDGQEEDRPLDATDETEARGELVAMMFGTHMSEALATLEQCDWSQVYPEVTVDGILTGRVVASDDDCILVDWDGHKLTTNNGHACEAAIMRHDAPARIIADHRRETGE